MKYYVLHVADVVSTITEFKDHAERLANDWRHDIYEVDAEDVDDAKWAFRVWYENKKGEVK